MAKKKASKVTYEIREVVKKKLGKTFYEVWATNDGKNWQFFSSGQDKEYAKYLIEKQS